MPLDDMARPLNLAAATLAEHRAGSARRSSLGRPCCKAIRGPLDLHRFVEVWPVLDHNALEPGGRATAAIREIVSQLGLRTKFGADVSLTGPVIISDNEFAGVHEGIALNSVVTGVIVLVILWLALRSVRLVAAVAVNIAAGLADHGGRRDFDGRRAQSDLAGVCGAVRRPRCRFRDSVYRSLSGGAPRDRTTWIAP